MKFKLLSVPALFILMVVIIFITNFDILDWFIFIVGSIILAIVLAIISIFSWIKSHIAPQNHNENSQRNNNYEDNEALDDFDDDDDDDFDDDDFDDDDDD